MTDVPASSVFPHGQMPGSLELAFVGDSVYDLYVRSRLVKKGGRVNVRSGFIMANLGRDRLFE